MTKTKIILVDDHQMFREGLKFLLSDIKNIQITGEATDGANFIKLLETQTPDIVLMDINMPNMNGIDAAKIALQMQPNIKIIVLSMFGDVNYYYQMIHAGVKGFVLKKSGSTELITAIDKVMNGEDYFSNELLKNVIMSFAKSESQEVVENKKTINLTDREEEVLTLICNGFSTKEIADKLSISTRTVEVHKSNLFLKTGVNTTGNLISFSIKNKLVDF